MPYHRNKLRKPYTSTYNDARARLTQEKSAIAKAMQNNGMTYQEIAAEMQVSTSTICRYLNGYETRRKPHDNTRRIDEKETRKSLEKITAIFLADLEAKERRPAMFFEKVKTAPIYLPTWKII